VLLGRVVDQDVQPAERGDRPADGLAAERLAPHVPGHPDSPDPTLLDQPDRLAGVAVLVQVDDGDARAFLRERDGHGAADAAVAPGDERDLAAELAGPSGRAIVRPGPRGRAGLDARLASLVLGRAQGPLR
jgi:hypothetical protein